MRVDLVVPYEEKSQAKARGAQWDAARKVWYVQDIEYLEPFLRWMKSGYTKPHSSKNGASATKDSPLKIIGCDCIHIPPWEHCTHST